MNPWFTAVMERGTELSVVYNFSHSNDLTEFIIIPIILDSKKFLTKSKKF